MNKMALTLALVLMMWGSSHLQPAYSAAASITMGETNVLGTDDTANRNLLSAQKTTLSSSATISSLSFYVTSAVGNLRLGIYSDAAGKPSKLLAFTPEITPVVGWNTSNVTSPVVLAAGTYWLAFLPQDNNLHFRRGSGGNAVWYSRAYGALPATISASLSSAGYHWSFYGTLSTDAAPTATPTLAVGSTPTPTATPTLAAGPTPTLTATASGNLAISNITDNADGYPNGQVPKYEKFEITFQISGTVASNLQMPFDPSPPPGINQNGITVDAVFTSPSGKTYAQPAFYYQDFTFTPNLNGSGKDWMYPSGTFAWKVRFAPTETGTWSYHLTAQDGGGSTSTQSSPLTLTVTNGLAGNHGFVQVSANDPRYFEFSDGTYFPSLGFNANDNQVDITNPVSGNTPTYLSKLSQNGVQVVREWLSAWAIFGSSWNPWFGIRNDYDGYLPRTGLITNGALSTSQTPSSMMSLRYTESGNTQNTAWFDACRALLPFQGMPAAKRNTNYHIMIRYKASGLSGPRVADAAQFPGGNNWGLVAKIQNPNDGNWYGSTHPLGYYCWNYSSNNLSTGIRLTPYGGNTSGWTYLEGNWSSGSSDFLPIFYLADENVTSSTDALIDIDKVYITEDLGGCSPANLAKCGPNIVTKGSMEHLDYFMDRNAFSFDRTVDLAHQNGVYFKLVVMDKNEQIENEIDYSGNKYDWQGGDNNMFFGNYRTVTAVRWLQQAWWRYLQARWGYSVNIHSWEATNEAAPSYTNHYGQVDEMGKFMHCVLFGIPVATGSGTDGVDCPNRGPNSHMVSTSFSTGFESGLFANSEYPNIDYADIHQYIPKDADPTDFYDTALATNGLSATYGAKQPSGGNKPVIRGETGLINNSANTDSYTSDINADTSGVWLHNLIWGGINPGGLIESYWYSGVHIYPGYTSASSGLLPLYRTYYNFINAVPLNNGHYIDAEAASSNANLRVWGQKDLTNGRAHLWIANPNHTWHNVVDNSTIAPLGGSITISGFQANQTYSLEWWNTYTGAVDASQCSASPCNSVTADGSGKIVLNVSNLSTDVAVKITGTGPSPTATPTKTSVPISTPTAGAAMTIGETNILGTDDTANQNLLSAQKTTLSSSATIRSLSFYVTSAAGNLRLGIYSDVSGKPSKLLAFTPEITPVVGWNTSTVTSPVVLAAGTYWLAFLPQNNNLHFRRGSGGNAVWYSRAYGALPATFSITMSSATYHWSFYGTLSTDAAPTATPTLAAGPTPTPNGSPTPTPPQTGGTDWPMAGANPQRTSHNSVQLSANIYVEWYRPITPYIDPKVQTIAANGQIFVASSKGLYGFDARTGAQQWVFGTEMPLGNSPTYYDGTLYVGGLDHRVYAVNASDGTLKSGWLLYEAGAGYETNPLVINDSYTGNSPVVLLGNRDSYFYALDANTGALKWKYLAGGPVRFSAAYKNGVIYFGDDSNVAYALNVADGSLKWKTPSPGQSGSLPGVGFSTYWPVVYHDSVTGTDYVLYSGSKKSAWQMFNDSNGNVSYNYETLTDPNRMTGCSGSDCSSISNYFSRNPEQRHFFVLNAATGVERVNPYAPVNWGGVTRGGNKYPPTVGGDNKIYTWIGFNNASTTNSTTGVQGWIAGWNFGTTQIKRIYNPASGAGDEPVAFTSGGNLVYWGEGVNGDAWGTVNTTNNAKYSWNPVNAAHSAGKYSSIDLNGIFGGANGTYSYFDGTVNMSPVPYNNKLYLIVGNTLIAMSTSGGNTNVGTSAAPTSAASNPVSLTASDLQQRLAAEIQKIINAGHLRPGFMDSGILSGAMGDICDGPCVPGNYLNQYFTSPADTLATLASAMPYLSPSLQSQLRTYLQTEETDYPVETDISIGWKNGAQREIYTDTSEMTKAFSYGSDIFNSEIATLPRTYWRPAASRMKIIPTNGSTPTYLLPDAFYGAWKYVVAEGSSPTLAKTMFDKMKNKLPTAGLNNQMTDANLTTYPYILNEYIIGYRGYLELEKLAGYITDIKQSGKYSQYNRLVNLRINTFSEHSPFGTDFNYNHGLNVARNFMYMTPELATILRSDKLSAVQTAVNDYQTLAPYWFVSKYDRTYGEAIFQPLYDSPAMFQTQAYVLQTPFTQLVKYLDVPAFAVGDLFYIQNLVAALTVAGP